MISEQIRKTLHDITFGIQNEYIEKTNYKPLQYDFIETCTVSDNKPVVRFILSPELKGKGITNLKIDGDWESLEVVIGGQLVDKIYKIWECNSPYILQAPYCIPFLEHHSIDICVSHNKQYTLTYDIVSVSHPCVLSKKECSNTRYDFVFNFLIFTGFEEIESDIQYTYIPFNNLIERLVVYCDNPVDYIKFHYGNIKFFNDKKNPLFTLSFQKINDTKWELDFGEQTVNFSRIERPFLEIRSFTKNIIGVFAVAKNIAIIKNGLFRLGFSK